jgi:predicted dehydrogenase
VATDAAFRREKAGGGALLDKGVHMLDQLTWMFGEPVVERAFDDSFVDGVEANSILHLAFPQARGRMQVSWESPLNSGLHIRGSKGEVFLDGEDIRSYRARCEGGWIRYPARTTWPTDVRPTSPRLIRPGNYHACFELQLVAMLRSIKLGEPFPVLGIQAARVQACIDRAYAIAEPMEFPWLSAIEQSAVRAKHWKGAR